MIEIALLDTTDYKITEICSICNVNEVLILEFVKHGILHPNNANPNEPVNEWIFHSKNLLRAQKAIRLHQDLGINLEGLGLILDLLEEVADLRQKLYLLE